MPRPKLPTPLVTSSSIGQARPLGATLPELWSTYLESADARNLSRSRLYSLRRTAELSRSLPDFPQWGEIYEWLTRLLPTRAPTTVRLHFWDLASLYNWGNAANFVGYNPLYKKKFKVADPLRRAIWNIHEKWPELLATAGDDERARAWLAVLRFTGLREGEALGLHATDIEQRQGATWLLRVRRQRSQHTLETTEALKTTTSRRQIEVHPALVPLLRPLLASGPASVKVGRGGGATIETPLLFPYRALDLERMIAKLRVVCPDDFTPDNAWHVFRHTCAVEWYRRGREVVQISTVLGHASIAYTQKYLRGFLGNDPTRGFFDGMDETPAYERAPTPPAPAPVQRAMPLGPLNAVPNKGGAPPGAEKRRAGPGATGPAPQVVQSSSNPRAVASTTEQSTRRTKKEVSL